jgi:hypothetical protein
MGEETKVLSNESIDVPSHENFLTPILVIRNSEEPNSKFSIKLNFGGVELKGNTTKVNCVYEKTCYRRCCSCWEISSSCICHIKKYIISTASSKFRIRFDTDKPLTLTTEYGVSIITLPNEFIEQMKGKSKMTIEIDDQENGKLWYAFNIEHLQGICEENNVYKFRTPTQKAIGDVVSKPPNYYQVSTQKSYLPHILFSVIIFICFVIWLCASNKEDTSTSQVLPSSDYYVDTCNTYVSSTDYKNQELKNIEKKEPIKKERKKIVKEENEDNEEYVYPYTTEVKTTTTYNDIDIDIEKYPLDKMIKYLKEKFPNAPEDQIIRMVKKSNVQYAVYKEEDKTEDIPTYTASLYKKSEGYYNYKEKQNEEQPKKKGLLKRLFPGRKNWNSSFYEKK